jgi:[acyl-carrier-protein] S-malonyltransferase
MQNKTLGFVFPGQGSQQIGMLSEMASHFPIIEKTFAEGSEALGKDLWALAQTGPEEALNATINTQPVLLTASVALWRLWQETSDKKPSLLAGHSLGEYSALVCSKALELSQAVKLVALRGQAMQEAVQEGFGAMAAILGMEDAALMEVCEVAAQGEVVSPVNFNAIGQTVIAGHKSAVERACTLAKEKGAKKVVLLSVSVPSHCALMMDASLKLAEALKNIEIKTPQIPVIQNVDVKSHDNPDDIKQCLVKQLHQPVRWVETMQTFAKAGIHHVVECGPGKVLTGLLKRIDPALNGYSLESKKGFDEALTIE